MLRKTRFFYSPADASSGGSGTEPTIEQLQQQLSATTVQYNLLAQKVEKGELVDPTTFLKTKIEAGEVFPKERFTGLQQTYQAEQEALKKTKETLTALTASEQDLKSKFSNLEKEKADLAAALQAKAAEVDGLAKKSKRANLVMEKFPELAPFEAKGLLPEGEEADLEALFGAFSSQLGSVREGATKDFAKGGAKPSPTSIKDNETPAPSGSQAYWKLANAALASGNVAEYNSQMDLYFKEMAKEAVK